MEIDNGKAETLNDTVKIEPDVGEVPGRARHETYNAHDLRYEERVGRPSKTFLEGSASDIIASMPDPRSAARLPAGIAEAHETSTPMQGLAVVEDGREGRKTVGHVRLVNAGHSTGVAISFETSLLSPEAAIELASALIYHAGAARAVQDLDIGRSSGCFDDAEHRRRGPARLPMKPDTD